MIDRTAALFKDLDAPRAVPAPARMRLVSALEAQTLPPIAENLRAILERPKKMPAAARARLELMLAGEDQDDADIALRMQGIDAPVQLTPLARVRLEHRIVAEQRRRANRIWQMTGAAAAAVLVLIGAVVLTRPGSSRLPGSDGAPPQVIRPTVIQTTPSVVPPVSPRPTGVLGARETRRPQAPPRRPGTKPAGAPALDPVFGDGVTEPVATDGAADRRGAPGLTPDARSSGGLTLLDPVTSLVSRVLSVLQGQRTIDDLFDISKANQPPSAKPQAATPAAPKRSRARSARAPSRSTGAPKPAAAGTAPKQQQPSGGLGAVTQAVDGVVRELVEVSVITTDVVPSVSLGL